MPTSPTVSRARAIARVAAGVFVLLVALGAPAAARADDQAVRRVLELVYAGRCDEALGEIAALRREADSAALARLEGQCRIRLKDYAGAVSALDDARRMDPVLEDVEAFRGIALYRLEDHAGARAALAAARGNTSAAVEPQLELYTGLVRLQAGESRAAAEALDRARLLDAGQVEPVASFYAGLAWQGAGERDLARESLLRVKAQDPDGVWGRRADELLSGRSFEERAWASILAGLEYDTNVVLLGDAVPLPQAISNESDGRALWFLEGGVELFHRGNWSGGVAATYAGNVQFTLTDFDIQYPRGSAWLDYDLDPDTLIRLRYGIGYAWVGYSPFLFTQDASLSLYRNWGRPGNTEVGFGWTWNDYRFPLISVPPGPSNVPGTPCGNGDPLDRPCSPASVLPSITRDRDGDSLRPFLLHRIRILAIDTAALRNIELRAGYAYEKYLADGSDWRFQGHDFLAGVKATLLFELRLDAQVAFSYRPFDYPSSYPPPGVLQGRVYPLSPQDRLDKITRLGTSLEKPINDRFSVAARYLYTRSASNVEVFEYSRHVIGGYATYRF